MKKKRTDGIPEEGENDFPSLLDPPREGRGTIRLGTGTCVTCAVATDRPVEETASAATRACAPMAGTTRSTATPGCAKHRGREGTKPQRWRSQRTGRKGGRPRERTATGRKAQT